MDTFDVAPERSQQDTRVQLSEFYGFLGSSNPCSHATSMNIPEVTIRGGFAASSDRVPTAALKSPIDTPGGHLCEIVVKVSKR